MKPDTQSVFPGDRFTAGPWFAEKSSADFWYITRDPDAFGRVIGQTWPDHSAVGEQEPNVRLMSAAPELLAALRLARCICEDAFKDTAMEWDEESMGVIDAAIAKAEGKRP